MSLWKQFRVRLSLSMLPAGLANLGAAITAHLNEYLLHYNDEFHGVVCSYSDVKSVESQGRIIGERPHIHFHVTVKFLVFAPEPDSLLGLF